MYLKNARNVMSVWCLVIFLFVFQSVVSGHPVSSWITLICGLDIS